MKNNEDINGNPVIDMYFSALQELAILANTQFMYFDIGRGSGKSTHILAPRLHTLAYALPRSIIMLGGPTYVMILDTILPGILTYFGKHYTRGIHYEFGKEPPKFFKRPFGDSITNWKHTISFPTGAVVQFVSVDRPESSIGKNASSFVGDEALRYRESDFIERVRPAIRGDRDIFGKSPFFESICFTSSSPNHENDHDWWLNYKNDMKPELIEKIQLTAFLIAQAQYKVQFSESENIRERNRKLVAKYTKVLDVKRKGATYFLEGTSFSNLMILGSDYIKNQFKGAPSTIEKAKLSLLGIRPNKIKDPFFSKFGKHNIFSDSYRYNDIDLIAADGTYKRTCRDLKYYDPNAPLQIGYDPGNFASFDVGQKKRGGKEFRHIKYHFVIPPEEHSELAKQFNDFWGEYSSSKTIYLYYDRAANQRKEKYKDNPKGETDAFIIKTELELLGWHVILMNLGQATIYHWQHFMLNVKLLNDKDKSTPEIYYCENECDALISSIRHTGRKRTENGNIEMDKSAERKLNYADQAFYSPQIATSMTYLHWGLYHQFMPDATPEMVDYEGM